MKLSFKGKYADHYDGDIIKCLNGDLSEKHLAEYVQTPLQNKGIQL